MRRLTSPLTSKVFAVAISQRCGCFSITLGLEAPGIQNMLKEKKLNLPHTEGSRLTHKTHTTIGKPLETMTAVTECSKEKTAEQRLFQPVSVSHPEPSGPATFLF